ncbi:hypothetical protein L484_009469 [Morus notabilis]|uniref:Uncharacterized protein n=1 Tax=Morus notabilis TaxID=981085 RepID=W9RWH8_9ROSA|nr:hypothetical protein L484_009469 [Morus notabilis]
MHSKRPTAAPATPVSSASIATTASKKASVPTVYDGRPVLSLPEGAEELATRAVPCDGIVISVGTDLAWHKPRRNCYLRRDGIATSNAMGRDEIVTSAFLLCRAMSFSTDKI